MGRLERIWERPSEFASAERYIEVRSNSIFSSCHVTQYSLENRNKNESSRDDKRTFESGDRTRRDVRDFALREVVAPPREIVAEGSNKNNDSTDNLRTSVVSVRSLS